MLIFYFVLCRVFPRSEPGGQPKSGLVVIQTETQSTLPYVVNNGFPYAVLTHTRVLFPECRCQTFGSVLKKSPALKRKVLMCSFEEVIKISDSFSVQGTHCTGKTGKMAKNILSGKKQGIWKFCQNTRNLVCSS